MVQPVPDRMDFPAAEVDILEYWKKIDAFGKSLKLAKGRPRYRMLLTTKCFSWQIE